MAPWYHLGCLRLFAFLLFVTGYTQQIILHPFKTSNAGCIDGSVVDGKDQVVMVGSVTTNGTRAPVFDFIRKRIGDAFYAPACSVDDCGNQSAAECYCQVVSGNTYTLVYNKKADVQDSNALIILDYNGDKSSDQRLPTVHGVERVSVTIAGGGSNIPLSNLCSQQEFYAGKTYDFKICGENLVDPEFYIGTGAIVGVWNKTKNNCSSFSVTPQTSPLIFAYNEKQACLRNGSVKCLVSDCEPHEPFDETCIIIIIAVVGIVVAGVVVVIIRRCYRKAMYCCMKLRKITTRVTAINMTRTLRELEQMLKLGTSINIFKYGGTIEYHKSLKLNELRQLEGVREITVSVLSNGLLVIDKFSNEKYPTHIFIINVSKTLKELKEMLPQDLQKNNPKVPNHEKVFLYEGKEEVKAATHIDVRNLLMKNSKCMPDY